MSQILLAYILTVAIFVGIDMIWLLGLGRQFYVSEIGSLMRPNPNIAAAIAFYLIYGAGLFFFAIIGALQTGDPIRALTYGALFGLVAYATYDLTNLAVMQGFTLKIALVDMVWGSVLSGTVAWIVAKIV